MILIVGGAGYIGSHVALFLQEQGYKTLVLDNLSTGDRRAVLAGEFIEGNLQDRKLLDEIFEKHPIEAVMHFAACIDVGESVRDPVKYYSNNVGATLVLLDRMRAHGVDKLVFSSTAAVYGLPQQERIDETHVKEPINPYGRSKRMVEEILEDCSTAYGLKFCALRYFNAAGGDPTGRLKNFKIKESNLIPAALRSLMNKGSLTLFGEDYPTPDGTCIRDYIHVWDLAAAHVAALRYLEKGNSSAFFNLGNGKGHSVKEVLSAVETCTGRPLKIIKGPKRVGDPPVLVADATRALQQLGWKPQHPALKEMINHAWSCLNTTF